MDNKEWYTVFIPTEGFQAVSVKAAGKGDAINMAQEMITNGQVEFTEPDPQDMSTWVAAKEVGQ